MLGRAEPGVDALTALLARLDTPQRADTAPSLWSRWLDASACLFTPLPRHTRPRSRFPALASTLFDPVHTPILNAASVTDDALLGVLRILCHSIEPDEPIDWRSVLPSHIGSAYESLLGLHPGSVADGRPFTLEPRRQSARSGAGAFYTPHTLVQHLLDESLEPLIRDVVDSCPTPEQRRDAILGIRICEPACGCGNFLVSAARRLADHVLAVTPPCLAQESEAFRLVLEQCIHGVDIDPLAVELARAALWLELAQPGASMQFLTWRIVCGDALVGGEARFVAQGIPDHALQARTPADSSALAIARRANRAERRSAGPPSQTDASGRRRASFDAWCAAFFAHPTGPGARFITTSDLADAPCADPPTDPRAPRFSPLAETLQSLAMQHRFMHWELAFPTIFDGPFPGFDLIIGNPPFLNQLESATASSRARAALLKHRTDGLIKRYADEASAFLAVCFSLLRKRDGSRLAFVQPQSVLSASDIIPLRRALLDESVISALWLSGGRMFADASVRTCALVLVRSTQAEFSPRCTIGPDFEPLPTVTLSREYLRAQDTWSELAAPAFGVPGVRLTHDRTLADIATATADFRDQYYGLNGYIVESTDLSASQQSDWRSFPPIITSGLIDLAACRWSHTPTRLLRRWWQAPRLDRRRMESHGDLSAWVDARLVPKILLATQPRVMEVLVDEQAHMLPSVPVITMTPREPALLWLVAAALASPVATAEAARRYACSGLHHHAIKLSARQSLTLPLPIDDSLWRRAAADFQSLSSLALESPDRPAALRRFARTSCQAFGLAEPGDLVGWWLERQGLSP
ncbi:MAG: SAM-dependent DNA methyltransferase [Leptolyngbya sp. PLA3]|nr:MAG: SAM-dependent DNA methyltransferase [Cyanobacteria bacterium CYA]MCE7969362.1 SAM-dependent DNA methyltransferase [Leptolyngbya sp. PL-A3]